MRQEVCLSVRGLFISFEGPDGAGKTTQIARVSAWLTKNGLSHVRTREPGGTAISDKIRQLLLNPEHREMKDETEVLLYAASRAQMVNEVILPALNEGKIVLCDRYVDASLAYQGYGLGYSPQKIASINDFATKGLLPRRTYLLDVPVEVGLNRIRKQRTVTPDRIEQKHIAYHNDVRNGFLAILEREPERFCHIDATQSPERIFSIIQSDMMKILSLGGN